MAHHLSKTYDSIFYRNIVNFVIPYTVHQHNHIAEDCPGPFLSPSKITGSNPSGGMDVGLL